MKKIYTYKSEEQEKYIKQILPWLDTHRHIFTHAVTLNINHRKMFRYHRKTDTDPAPNTSQVLDLCLTNLRIFTPRLAKRLYGNAWKKYEKPFIWIPMVEGHRDGEKLHFHCTLGVDSSRHEILGKTIYDLWTSTPYGSDNIDVKPYIDSGWTDYSLKSAQGPNVKDIVWESVLVPRTTINC
jgi:hypothetical protein